MSNLLFFLEKKAGKVMKLFQMVSAKEIRKRCWGTTGNVSLDHGLEAWGVLFVFQHCCKKILQTGGIKTTDINCLIVLEAESLKLGYWQGCASSEDSGEDPFLLLPASDSCRCSVAAEEIESCLPSSHGHLLYVCVQISLSCKNTCHIGLRVYTPVWACFN